MAKQDRDDATTPKAETRTTEDWRDSKRTPGWLYAATKYMHRWPLLKFVSEAEYDRAVDAAANVRMS